MVAKISATMRPVRIGPMSVRKKRLKPASGSWIAGITPRSAMPKIVMEIQVNWMKPMNIHHAPRGLARRAAGEITRGHLRLAEAEAESRCGEAEHKDKRGHETMRHKLEKTSGPACAVFCQKA